MNNEYIYLISIIKSVLTNTPFTHFLDVSYSKLFTIAKVHNVENFLYYGLIKNPSFDNSKYEEFSTRVTMAFKESLFKVATQGAEIEDLMKTFESEHIKFMPLKGAVIKNLYPHIDLRSMADFDCYFDKTQAKLIKKIMINLGYTVEMFNKGNHDVYYKKPYMNVEMHRELMNECYKISKYYKNINKKLILKEGSHYEYQMTKEDFFIYMIAHSAKHFAYGGTGIRTFIDVYLFIHNYESLNYEYIYQELDLMGLSKYAKASIDLSNYWFGNNEETILINNFEECVFNSGTYGTLKHSASIAIFMNEDAINNLEKSKSKYILKRLFPSKETMNIRNPITKKMPILLPWFYFTRLLKGIFHIKKTKEEVKDVNNISKENVEKLKNLHEDLNVKGKI